MSDIIDRLNEACKGYPAAWPHRLLHDAISEIERLRGVAQNENMALRGELNKALREIVDLRMPISGDRVVPPATRGGAT